MSFRITVSLIFVITLASCAGVTVPTKVGGAVSPTYIYLTDAQQEVNVGVTMTSSAPLVEHKKIETSTQIKATVPHRNKVFNVTAAPGIYRLIAEDSNGQFYEAEDTVIDVNSRKVVGGIYIPNNVQSKPALYWHWEYSLKNFPNGVVYIASFDDLPKYDISRILQPSGSHGLVSTLTYAWVAGGQIKLVYREYTNGLARDAFTQEVSLDYKPGSTYAYKTAKFIVHSADNISISYTLLSPL